MPLDPSKAALKVKTVAQGPVRRKTAASASCSGSSRGGSARRPAATSSAATRATTCARSSSSPRPRHRAAAPRRREPPGTVPVTRVTVIDAEPRADDADAADWLRARRGARSRQLPRRPPRRGRRPGRPRPGPRARRARRATAAATRSPRASGPRPASCRCPSRRKQPRRSKHRPAERLAALMSARDAVLACEELTLRARGDLDCGRHREAALQLEAALLGGARRAGRVARDRRRRARALDELAGVRSEPVAARGRSAAREGRARAGADVGDRLAPRWSRARGRAPRPRDCYAAE